jgi:hypothetical protein
MTPLARSQDEIAERFRRSRDDDTLGFRAEVLIGSLDYEHAKPFLKSDVGPQDWTDTALTVEVVSEEANKYLGFAFGKALDHRGLSAGRSVQKLTEWAWLLGRDDVVEAMDSADYAQYGVPKLVAFARGFDLPVPEDEELERMARGERCRPDCEDGCS